MGNKPSYALKTQYIPINSDPNKNSINSDPNKKSIVLFISPDPKKNLLKI